MFELQPGLKELKQRGLYRNRRLIQSPQGIKTIIDGRELVSFCSNDYLGLANHPLLKQAFAEADASLVERIYLLEPRILALSGTDRVQLSLNLATD